LPLQGPSFRSALSETVRATLPDTFVIVDGHGRALVKGDAVIHMLARSGGLWRLLGIGFQFVPRPPRNFGYECVGRVRHRLFAKPDAMCPLMAEALRVRFSV
jgi:predicted DCC family thiol-disulfide oxidoreductase YuxK